MFRTVVLALALVGASAFAPSIRKSVRVERRTATRGAMEMRTPIMAGNWKMNPPTVEEAKALADAVGAVSNGDAVEVVVTPPYPFLDTVATALKDTPVKVAAQGCFFEDKGAYTGAVAISMIESIGCDYVLAGHSERRVLFKDDDTAINRKTKKILSSGKTGCILCIGESLEEYEAGLVGEICNIQLAKDLAGVTAEEMARVVIAYEPVWAIGTGLTCPPDVAQKVHVSIRAWLAKTYGDDVAQATRIQYGGSVTPDTVKELMSQPDIDGCLVGGASLDAEKFGPIMNFQ